jgi:hypothetical protein
MNTKRISSITLWINRLVAVVVTVLIFALPALLDWYGDLLGYHPPRRDLTGIAVAFDLCAVAMLIALWSMEKLLQNIRNERIFVAENVKRVKCVRWCCGAVAVICLVATFFALPMLIFAAIMAFLCLVVSVVGCVLEAAVAIREENDLTI